MKERRSLLTVHWHALLVLLLIIAIIVPIVAYLQLPSSSASSLPTLSVSKIYNTSLKKGQTIIVNVTVSHVSNLISYYFELAFNASVLQVTADPKGLKDPITGKKYGIYEGPFLTSASSSTDFLTDGVSNTEGFISAIYEGIMAAGKSSSGSGVLTSINFTCVEATTNTAINITGMDQSIAQNLTGTSVLQTTTSFSIEHQDLNGVITANAPPASPGVWTEPWFQATLIVIVIEIIIVVLGILVTIRGWRAQAETEIKERDELDELLR